MLSGASERECGVGQSALCWSGLFLVYCSQDGSTIDLGVDPHLHKFACRVIDCFCVRRFTMHRVCLIWLWALPCQKIDSVLQELQMIALLE